MAERTGLLRLQKLLGLVVLLVLTHISSAFAQGSIFGTVQNSNLTTPANGEISFYGFTDNTDNEIRLESSVGAGYDAGNWFDDFQNFLSKTPGNPYTYRFYNTANGEGAVLAKTIPNNSFQQEDIALGAVTWPSAPAGMAARIVSATSVVLTWTRTVGQTYHVYRRAASSAGSFFRLDNTSGLLSAPGVADSFFVDNTVSGGSSYDYLLIAQNGSGTLGPHSAILTVSTATVVAPSITSITPNSGSGLGGTAVTIAGSGFDMNGATVTVGGAALTAVVVVSPYQITGVTPAGTAGAANVVVQNTASALSATLTGGYTYLGNQAPVLAAIGAKSVAEGAILNFGVTASDADATIPTLTTSTLPTNASFTDNGNGTGTFNFAPDFTQAGGFDVTFRADDGTSIDSEVVTITVNNVNQAPVLAAIGAKSVAEGAALNFGVSATDADGTPLALTTSTLPANAGFTDNGNGTGSFAFNPTLAQSGIYNVTFRASDGSAIDSEVVTITVTNVNQAPVLAAIGPKSVAEGATLNFGISASDPDGSTPGFTTSTLPPNAGFVDNGDGTGTFTFNPNLTQAGIYSITFRATDGTAVDSEVVAITVTGTNQAPVLAAIGGKAVAENSSLNFGVSASDPDGTTPTLTTSALPDNALFTDNGNGTGSFVFAPDLTQAGPYSVTFYASDGIATDSEVVAITVSNTNQAPILAAIGPRLVTEGQSLTVNVSATDADGTTPALSTTAPPANATFTDNGNGTGTFFFSPTLAQSGIYNVTFYASDGSATDSEVVQITVTELNQVPVLAAIGPKSVAEGAALNFSVSATDGDGTTPVLTTSTLPTNASFVDNGNGTGSFAFNPSLTQAGPYSVTFYASDGGATDSEVVAITVTNTNQAPVLAAIGNKGTGEGQLLTFGVSATDPDATNPVLTTSTLPANASFSDNGNGTGSFSFSPDFTQTGSYNVTFYASDGAIIDSEQVTITVNNVNQAPILAAIGSQSVSEGQTLNVPVTAADADGTAPTLTTSILPANATFTDNGNGTGSFAFTPSFTQAGPYSVTFYASDGSAIDSEVVAITVIDAGNQAPVLAAIGPKSVTEGLNLNFGVSASDIDGTTPTLSTSVLPANAGFTDNGNGTGTFNFTPGFTQAGSLNVTFYATDGGATDSEVVTITVNEAGNQTPVLAAIGPKSVVENLTLAFGISASDVDGTVPSFTTSALPANATFTDNGNGTASFSFTPTFTQAGSYDVTFRATDGAAADSEVVTITVTDAGNQAPVLAAIGPKAVAEGAALNFSVSASDVDGTTPVLTTSTLPTNATFVDNGNGTGSFGFSPDFTQGGTYNVTYYASDGTATDSEQVTITVTDAGNQSPVLAAIGSQSVTEGQTLAFGVSATDPDGATPSLFTSSLPANASFSDNGNGTGSFSFTPSFLQTGSYDITFYASDGSAIDSELVSITVDEAGNQSPVLLTIGNQTTAEGEALNLAISATDLDNTTLTLSTSALPTNATFVDNGGGNGLFSFTPSFTQAGSYDVTFYVSDGTATDSEQVTITVTDAGNQAPVLAAIGPQTVTETQTLSFGLSATDADGTVPSFSTSTLPANASFVDNGDGTASFIFTPSFAQGGSYDITFRASDGSAIDSEVVTITVNDAGNQDPVLTTIGPKSVTEGQALNFTVFASDVDGTIPVLTTSSLPINSGFTDNGDGTGSFAFTPGFTQAGSYNVTFYAADGSATDSETVVITVLESGNVSPIIAAVADTSVNEGGTLSLTVSATDPDGATPPLVSVSTTLLHYSFVDNGDGTGTLTYAPNYFDAGLDTVRFFATDNSSTPAVEIAAITTVDINRAPTFLPSLPKQVAVNDSIVFTVAATDSTDPLWPRQLYLSAIQMPTGAQFTDNGNSTGTFRWSPNSTQVSSYQVIFLASDQGTPQLTGNMPVVVNVVTVNQAPVLNLASTEARIVTEGQTLTINVTATDPDGVAPTITAENLPANAVVNPTGPGTAEFVFQPDFTQGGSRSKLYTVTIKASDGSLTDKSFVTIQVNDAGPQAPVFDSIPAPSVTEGEQVVARIKAHDPDGLPVTLRAVLATLPTNATFTDSGNGLGVIVFTPFFNQAGTFTVTVIVNDGTRQDTAFVVLTVLEAGNQTPVLATIADATVKEAVPLVFSVTAADSDGDKPILTTGLLPTGATFQDFDNGTGSFSWVPANGQIGTYQIMFYAEDRAVSGLFDSQQITVTVTDSNFAPIIITYGGRTMSEGDTLRYRVDAFDADSTKPILSATLDGQTSLAPNMVFVDSGNGVGVLTFTPDYTQGGVGSETFRTYNVRFYATDFNDGSIVTASTSAPQIRVNNKNAPPVLTLTQGEGPFALPEGQTLSFSMTSTDPDGSTLPTITATNLPLNSTFTGGTLSKTFTFTPDFTQAGVYTVRFYATDVGGAKDSAIVTITVNDAGNQPSTFSSILPDTMNIASNVTTQIVVRAADPERSQVVLTVDPLLPNAIFVDSGNGVGVYTISPDSTQVGSVWDVVFVAQDALGASTSIQTHLRVVNFLRGDLDQNGKYSLIDLASLLNYLLRQGPAPISMSAADVNGDKIINLADIAFMINFLYSGGPRPPQ